MSIFAVWVGFEDISFTQSWKACSRKGAVFRVSNLELNSGCYYNASLIELESELIAQYSLAFTLAV